MSVHVYIQEFHFRPRNSDTCLPCDCYPVGSFSRACDPESGQCQCRPGVIGRQCNSCDNPFAEVTNSGCEGEKKKQVNWVCNLCLFIFSLFSLKKRKKKKEASTSGSSELCVCVFIVIFCISLLPVEITPVYTTGGYIIHSFICWCEAPYHIWGVTACGWKKSNK